jgi:hypothetical protein
MSSVPSDFLPPQMDAGGLPPPSKPIPNEVSDSMLKNELRRQIYTDLTIDPEADPNVKKGRQIEQQGLEWTADRSKKVMQSEDAFAQYQQQNKPPEPPLKAEAPKFADYAKQASPMLLILTQLAGGKMGVSAHGMLGALKGQLDATTQGNIDAYTRARQEWEDHWSTAKENWQNQNLVYQNTLKNYEGQIGAEMKAAEAAEMYAGAGEKMVGNAYTRLTAKGKLFDALTKLERVEQQANNSARLNALNHVLTNYQKSESGITRIDQAEAAIKDNISLMPQLLARYKATVGANDKDAQGRNIILPEKFGKFMEAMSSDPVLGEFSANLLSLKSALVGIDMPAGTRGNLFLNKLFSGTAPDAFSDSASQIQTKLFNDFNVIEEAKKRAQGNMKMWSDLSARLGYNIQTIDDTPSIDRSKYPAHKDVADQIAGAKAWLADPKNAKDPDRAAVEARVKELESSQ